MPSRPSLLIVALAALLAACATPAPSLCPDEQQAMISESLYFGTEKPGGTVSAGEWQAFLNESVTPRFPQGLSVWPAAGQWKSDAGPIVRETSYVLNIVHAGGGATDAALNEIVGTYRTTFQQEAVLRVRSAACVSFR
jgi:hypothetical protein